MTKSLIIMPVSPKGNTNKHLTMELSNHMTDELSYYLVVFLLALLTFLA